MSGISTSATARFGYVPGLDGLRLLAVAIVIVAHYRLLPNVPGGFGVSIFFFISGFLISRLLLAEERTYGRIALGRFYIRRLIRLLPPLLLMGVVAVPLLVWIDPVGFSWSQLLLSFAYLGNVQKMGARLLGWDAGYDALEPLWSLAVEEHFYLLLPPVLLFVRSRTSRIILLAAILVGALALRMAVWWMAPQQADSINYNFTLTRIDAIGWGVLLTLLLDAGVLRVSCFERRAYWLLWGGSAAMIASLVHWADWYEVAFKYTPQSIAIGVAFCGLIFPERTLWARRIAEWPTVRYLGRISYELYLWHFPIYFVVGHFLPAPYPRALLSLVLTAAVSALAYSVTTQRLGPLRKRYGSHPV